MAIDYRVYTTAITDLVASINTWQDEDRRLRADQVTRPEVLHPRRREAADRIQAASTATFDQLITAAQQATRAVPIPAPTGDAAW
jgi:hypothetical protein